LRWSSLDDLLNVSFLRRLKKICLSLSYFITRFTFVFLASRPTRLYDSRQILFAGKRHLLALFGDIHILP
jgi:hypothetical protein